MSRVGENIPIVRNDVERRLRRIETSPTNVFSGARLLRAVTLTNGVTKRFAHGLGRQIQGYLVVGIRNNAAACYLDDEHDNRHTDTDTFAYIRADGASPTVDLVVF